MVSAANDKLGSEKKDAGDVLDTLSKLIAAIVMPTVLAVIGYYVQS
jgi:hypothetical protein